MVTPRRLKTVRQAIVTVNFVLENNTERKQFLDGLYKLRGLVASHATMYGR